MGVAGGDYSGDGLDDLLVTNSREQLHAAYRGRAGEPFVDARPAFAPALGQSSTGWGATWADLDNDGGLEIAIANGAIPIKSLARDAEPPRDREHGDARRARPSRAETSAAAATGAASLPRTSTTTATSISPSLDRWAAPAPPKHGAAATGSRSRWALPPGTRRHGGARRRAQARPGGAGGRATSRPRTRACTSGSGTRTVRELVVERPGGAVTRLRAVQADRLVTVRAPG